MSSFDDLVALLNGFTAELQAKLKAAQDEVDNSNQIISEYTGALCVVRGEKENLKGDLEGALGSVNTINSAVDGLDLNCDTQRPQQQAAMRGRRR